MKPDEPDTRTFITTLSLSACFAARQFDRHRHEAGKFVLRAEGEEIPMDVSGQPRPQLEVGDTQRAVEPDRGDLGHRKPGTTGLGHQIDADLETLVALDAYA